MNKWNPYDTDNPDAIARGIGVRIMLWTVAFLVFILIISGILWALGVGLSDIKGQGDAYKKKNDATNRIAASERFEDRYQDILAADRRIDAMQQALELDPSNVNKINLNGAINYCIDVVGDYNADARKYTAEQFRAEDLPAVIDNSDPATDCAPSK